MEITDSAKKSIDRILRMKDQIKESTKNLKEETKKVANELEVTAAYLNRMIAMAEKERKTPGTLSIEKDIIESAETLF